VVFNVLGNPTVQGCPANPKPTTAFAAIFVATFNDGSSTGADDRTGDHVAIFEAGEISGHTAGVLVVRAVIIRCDDKTCDSSTELPGAVDFPQTVQDGVPFTLRLIWDKANNQFLAA